MQNVQCCCHPASSFGPDLISLEVPGRGFMLRSNCCLKCILPPSVDDEELCGCCSSCGKVFKGFFDDPDEEDEEFFGSKGRLVTEQYLTESQRYIQQHVSFALVEYNSRERKKLKLLKIKELRAKGWVDRTLYFTLKVKDEENGSDPIKICQVETYMSDPFELELVRFNILRKDPSCKGVIPRMVPQSYNLEKPAKYGLKEYNKKETKKLKLIKIMKARWKGSCSQYLCLTLKVKDKKDAADPIKTCKVKLEVFQHANGFQFELLSFGLCYGKQSV